MSEQIKWDSVSVRVDKWKRLQALCEQLEPHEHYDGMNECNVCDEPLTDTLIRQCEKLLAAQAQITAQLAELNDISATLGTNEGHSSVSHILALKEQNESLRADAERYRHMRSNAQFQNRNGPGIYWYLPRWDGNLPLGKRLDAAIDAAISAGKEKP